VRPAFFFKYPIYLTTWRRSDINPTLSSMGSHAKRKLPFHLDASSNPITTFSLRANRPVTWVLDENADREMRSGELRLCGAKEIGSVSFISREKTRQSGLWHSFPGLMNFA
jgi:hypothetical protein